MDMTLENRFTGTGRWLTLLVSLLAFALCAPAAAKKKAAAEEEPPAEAAEPAEPEPTVPELVDIVLAAGPDELTKVTRDLWWHWWSDEFKALVAELYADESEEATQKYIGLCVASSSAFAYHKSEWDKSTDLMKTLGEPLRGGMMNGDARALTIINGVMEEAAMMVGREGGDGKKAARAFAAFGMVVPGGIAGFAMSRAGGMDAEMASMFTEPFQNKVELSEAGKAGIGPLCEYLRNTDLDAEKGDRGPGLLGLYVMVGHLEGLSAEQMLASFSVQQVVMFLRMDWDGVDEVALVMELSRRGQEEEVSEQVQVVEIEFIERLGDMLLERSAFAADEESEKQLEEVDAGLQALAVKLRANLPAE